jgi:aldehyde dehydrogenase (NAD+)
MFKELVDNQHKYFATHETKDVAFRLRQLQTLRKGITDRQKDLEAALWADLHKSPQEVFLAEYSIVIQEIDNHIRRLRRWSKPRAVRSPLSILPSRSRIIYEPLGVSLIMAPWNYPFQLLFNPLVGAISAGCCAVLKSSPYVPQTAQVMSEIISACFPKEYIAFTNGNRDVNKALLEQRFDMIFFTGSPLLGKTVMRAAAEHLTPVVLELGGKSPCIIDRYANIEVAARRVAWGKTINAGQTCVAPDYLFVHQAVKDRFVSEYKLAVERMYGVEPKQSPLYPRIVSEAAAERLQSLFHHGKTVYGGDCDLSERYVAPSLIEDADEASPLMQDEIFGPILPLKTFDALQEVVDYVNNRHKPLALYYFGKDRDAKTLLKQVSSGGACINDTLIHLVNHRLPFGGVGNSGMGKYHGRDSFLVFSNARATVWSPAAFDLPFRYPPFKYFNLIKRVL